MIDFKRKLYIEDLFVPKQIINAFEYVEFNSHYAFTRASEGFLFNIKKNTTVQIRLQNYQEFKQMLKLFKTTEEFFEKMEVILVITTKKLLDEIMSKEIPENFKATILTVHPYKTSNYWEINNKWIRKHIIGLIHFIHADTIANDICKLIEYYNTHSIRFFRLYINYESFLDIPIKDLNKIEFWFNYLKNWMFHNDKDAQTIEIINKNFHRRIFVDDDLTLYLDAHKDKTTWFFPLFRYREDTGETIDKEVLNNLHKYMDLSPQTIYSIFPINNWLLIDFNQTKKMGYFINEIPLIMGLIQRWLYGN